VGKSLTDCNNLGVDRVEVELPLFRKLLATKGYFAYAWSFNPREWAMDEVRRQLVDKGYVWLYLIEKPWQSPVKVRIKYLRHSLERLPCPEEWIMYAPQYANPPKNYIDGLFKEGEWWKGPRDIHLWFLADKIEELSPAQNLKHLDCYFGGRRVSPRYCEYKQKCFAFLRAEDDC
jgi:hypothetical protein